MLAFEIKISSIKDNKRDFGTFKIYARCIEAIFRT